VALEAERVAPALDHAAVAAEERAARGLDPEHGLDALEVAAHAIGRELLEPELVAPLREDAIRRAVTRARVDRGGAADGLSERDRDPDVADGERRAAAPVQLLLHLERAAREVRALEVAALLDEHHGEPGLGELAPDDGPARARADHDDVALDREVTLRRGVHAVAHVRRLRLVFDLVEVVDAADRLVQARVVCFRRQGGLRDGRQSFSLPGTQPSHEATLPQQRSDH